MLKKIDDLKELIKSGEPDAELREDFMSKMRTGKVIINPNTEPVKVEVHDTDALAVKALKKYISDIVLTFDKMYAHFGHNAYNYTYALTSKTSMKVDTFNKLLKLLGVNMDVSISTPYVTSRDKKCVKCVKHASDTSIVSAVKDYINNSDITIIDWTAHFGKKAYSYIYSLERNNMRFDTIDSIINYLKLDITISFS